MLSKVVSAVSVCVGVSRAAENGACSMHASQVHSRVTPSILDRARTAQERAGELDHHTLSDNNHDNDLISQQNPMLNPRVRTDHSASLLRAIKKKRRFVVQTEHLSNNGKWMETQLFEVDEYAPSVIHPLHGSVLGYFTKSDNGQLYWNEYSVRDSFETPDREEIEMNELINGQSFIKYIGSDVRMIVSLVPTPDPPSKKDSPPPSTNEPATKKSKHMRRNTSMVQFRDEFEVSLKKMVLKPNVLTIHQKARVMRVLSKVADMGGFRELDMEGDLQQFLDEQGAESLYEVYYKKTSMTMSVDELMNDHIKGEIDSKAWKEWFGYNTVSGMELRNAMRLCFDHDSHKDDNDEYHRKILYFMIDGEFFFNDEWLYADPNQLRSLMLGTSLYSIRKEEYQIPHDLIHHFIGQIGSDQRKRFFGELSDDINVQIGREEARIRDVKLWEYHINGDQVITDHCDGFDDKSDEALVQATDHQSSDDGSGNPNSSTEKQSINANIQQPRVEIDLTVEEDEPTLVQCRRGRPMFFF